ncbi:MAG: hypothetical protein ACREF8_02350 [Chthoniobacterales bacterium]
MRVGAAHAAIGDFFVTYMVISWVLRYVPVGRTFKVGVATFCAAMFYGICWLVTI